MIGLRVLAILWFAIAALCAHPAAAKRAALIIGNGQYQNVSYLKNPVNDARLIAESARRAGFDVVLLTDLNMHDFEAALRDFRNKADGAEVAMIYFAGHGVENAGMNWLVPVDAKLAESRDLRYEAIELDGLLETLQGARLRMVVLDACRNNPFGNNWRSGARAVTKGLAEAEIEGALVMYAAAGGQVAIDGSDGNSPFARSLAQRLVEPGLSIHRLGSVVLEDVITATGGQQRPWTNMSIGSGDFFLVDGNNNNAPRPLVADAVVANASDQSTADGLMWQGAETSKTAGGYQAYLNVFPKGMFARIARERIDALTGPSSQTGLAATDTVPTSPGPDGGGSALAAYVARQPSSQAEASPAPVLAMAAPEGSRIRDISTTNSATNNAGAPANGSMGGNGYVSAARPLVPASPAIAPPPAATGQDAPASPPPPAAGPVAEASGAPAPQGSGAFTNNRKISYQGLRDTAALPTMPPAPNFDASSYPGCREDFQAAADAMSKIVVINNCMSALDHFAEKTLNGFARMMKSHQEDIARMYNDQVAGQMVYGAESQDKFYQAMLVEHASSNPDGGYFKGYDQSKAHYNGDRAYLQDRYCFWSGSCGGYPPQPGVAPPKN